MAKQIKFKLDEKGFTYVLEFNRNALVKLEKDGFSPNLILDQPITQLELLFTGAFLMHHPTTKIKEIKEIYSKMGDKEKLHETLVEMWTEAMETLNEQPEKANLVKWEVQ